MTGFGGWKNWIVKLENFPKFRGENQTLKQKWPSEEKRSGPQVPEKQWWNTPCTDIGLGDAEASSNVGLWGANVLRHLRRKRVFQRCGSGWMNGCLEKEINGWNPVDTGGLFKAKLYPKAPCIVTHLPSLAYLPGSHQHKYAQIEV